MSMFYFFGVCQGFTKNMYTVKVVSRISYLSYTGTITWDVAVICCQGMFLNFAALKFMKLSVVSYRKCCFSTSV